MGRRRTRTKKTEEVELHQLLLRLNNYDTREPAFPPGGSYKVGCPTT